MPLKKSSKVFIVVIAYIVITGVLLLLIPGSDLPDVEFPGADKVAHFCLFAILSAEILLITAWVRGTIPEARHYVITIIMFLTAGVITEVTQSAIPDRSMDFSDFIIDILGGTVGILLFRFAGTGLLFYNGSE